MKKLVFWLVLVLMSPINVDASELSNKLKGRILLQVEESGEAWYVNPDNEERYYLGRPYDAFNVMRELGLGVSNNDFDSFGAKAPVKLLGKIILKVEDSGKAYYVNPEDLSIHYLGRPFDAFSVMRELGLGISNDDLEKITVSEFSPILLGEPNKKIDINEALEKFNNSSPSVVEKKPSDYLNSVFLVECYDNQHNLLSSGSGSLVDMSNLGKGILTNRHVITSDSCIAIVQNDSYFGIYDLDTKLYSWNNYSDVAFINILKIASGLEKVAISIEDLDYSLSEIKMCGDNIMIGDKVYIIGYPSYGDQLISSTGGILSTEIMTEGIISGYNSSVKIPLGSLPYDNYFISSKIDSGNSGGLALVDKNDSLCFLGLPTWLSKGTYENQGLVQNINNIIYVEK